MFRAYDFVMFFLFTGGAGRKACDSLPGLFNKNKNLSNVNFERFSFIYSCFDFLRASYHSCRIPRILFRCSMISFTCAWRFRKTLNVSTDTWYFLQTDTIVAPLRNISTISAQFSDRIRNFGQKPFLRPSLHAFGLA